MRGTRVFRARAWNSEIGAGVFLTPNSVRHLQRVRDLQDETGGFTAFIPWTFQEENTAMDGTVDHTFMQLPGVESGGPYPFGKSTMLTQWVLNQYFNWPHNTADVTSVRSESYSP